MLLYLLRHADADTPAPNDASRPLSEKGHEQARKVARFMEAHGLHLSLIISSPLRRARETAAHIAELLHAELLIAPWLACGMSPYRAIEELSAHRSEGSLMIVGHEPDFSQLTAYLLTASSGEMIHVRKASLTCFEVGAWRPGGVRLEFSVPCRLM